MKCNNGLNGLILLPKYFQLSIIHNIGNDTEKLFLTFG